MRTRCFLFEGCYFGLSSGDVGDGYHFFSCRFVKESVLGGDVYFGWYCP